MRSFEVSFAEDKPKKSKNMVVGSIIAIVCLLGTSSILPLADGYQGVSSVLRLIWRWQMLVAYCLPFSIYFWFSQRDQIDIDKVLCKETGVQFFTAAMLWMTASNLLLLSSDYTIVGRAALFGNLGGVFLVGLRL
mmetsp:Transcript_23701/g.23593  ORF Transcript_23701/g.23593 Transcript_23701/m.23593 type:complete len:135 (+) Transcript_23701:2-406(+)